MITPSALKPRKVPHQARATATLDAIFEATIQVLLAEGISRLSTTRVAARAGVSIGTMYQYYPHKQALLYAALERHLRLVTDAVTDACRSCHGQPAAVMTDTLVAAYFGAKTARCDVTKALYLIVAEVDTAALIENTFDQMGAATQEMLATASDTSFEDLPTVSLTLLMSLSGTVRGLFERDLAMAAGPAVCDHLTAMFRSYMGTTKRQRILSGQVSTT